MAFKIIQADITKLTVDAIVNPTDQHYSGGGGVDLQLHDICGPKLNEATDKLLKLHLGEAKATEAFGLNCKYIIHTSGPHWTGISNLEKAVLGSCYRNSVLLANSLGCKSIAFPLIASKGKHFPKEVAFTVAVDAIKECVAEYPDIDITLTIFDTKSGKLPDDVFKKLTDSINETYTPSDTFIEYRFSVLEESRRRSPIYGSCYTERICSDEEPPKIFQKLKEAPTQKNVQQVVLEENFASMLNRLFKEKNFSVTKIQDEVGLSGAALSKLRNGLTNPKKLTVFALAIAFKLNIKETEDFLMKAGYAVNKSSLEDVVIAALIQDKTYDRNEIDDLLDSLALTPLPGSLY